MKKVYHGSTTIVKNPLCNVGRDDLDFGKGFYLTDILNQEVVDKYLIFKKSEIVTL